MRALVNRAADPAAVPPVDHAARAFHAGLGGATPVRPLPRVAAELGLAAVCLKDESARFGLPAFKVLGASWAVQRTLAARDDVTTLVTASAGNHGRAVAHVAALRGLRCVVHLPARAVAARREAIAGEGATVVAVDGSYEDAVAAARAAGGLPGCAEIADVGDGGPAHWVIDGYATLFAELAEQTAVDVLLVPAGVGSLAAAAARHGAQAGIRVVAVEPDLAPCLTASLAAGRPTAVPTPGTSMAGLDCAEVSPAAWPSLLAGIHGTVVVSDPEAHAAMRDLHASGLAIGDSGAAPLAGLRALMADPACAALRGHLGLDAASRVALIATEGVTDPEGYARVTGPARSAS